MHKGIADADPGKQKNAIGAPKGITQNWMPPHRRT